MKHNKNSTNTNKTKSFENRVINFSAGPSILPLDVLKTAQQELLSWHGCGQSVMEMSHRSKQFAEIYNNAVQDLRQLLNVPSNYHIFFLQGGATMQFSAIPLNFNIGNISKNSPKKAPQYIVTGNWSNKAYKEAIKYGDVDLLFSSIKTNPPCTTVPNLDDLKINEDAAYLHMCVNETIHGVLINADDLSSSKGKNPKKKKLPPIVADMSSCFMSQPVDVSKFAMIYAGAQKNVGPAGLTVVIIRDDMIGFADPKTPILLNYATWKKKEIYNTPPCYSIYMLGLVMKKLKKMGGLKEMEKLNLQKAKLIYDVLDEGKGDFYRVPVEKRYRSLMNVRFNIIDQKSKDKNKKNCDVLEKKFIEEAEKKHNMFNLKGHSSLGGIRASIYNAQPMENCQKLAKFIVKFRKENLQK